jgi:butyrate kinase
MGNTYRILVINFGSTSTKLALYENETEICKKSVSHTSEEVQGAKTLYDQAPFRKQAVMDFLNDHNLKLSDLSAIAPRPGLTPSLEPGAYIVNERMVDCLLHWPVDVHVMNMSAVVAYELAKPLGIPVYSYDCPTMDQMLPEAKITGFPEIMRNSIVHIENMREVGFRAAKEIGRPYEDLNLIIAHLGGGITMGLHRKGRIVDLNGDDTAYFCPERSGSFPSGYFADLCYSGKYDHATMRRRVRGRGGLYAHLGTSDCIEVERRIENGDEHARLIYYTMAYQLAKGIGMLAVANAGDIDRILLTGGLANSKMLTDWITEKVSFIAPVMLYPGEYEIEHAALGVLRVLRGEEKAQVFDL